MEQKKLTIDDLLNALRNPNKPEKGKLPNTAETWARIGSKDKFEELGLNKSELASFLEEWMADNDYDSIS